MGKRRVRTPLGDLLEQKIAELAGGSQSEFARRAGLPRTTINRIVQGVTHLPEADVRRKLAKAMGIRHVDFFILAGELWPEEIPTEGQPRDLFPRGTPHAKVVELLRELDDASALMVASFTQWRIDNPVVDIPVIIGLSDIETPS